MGDVVERALEAGDEGADAVEHLVEQVRQVVQGVAVAAHGDAVSHLARAHDPAQDRAQPA